jgi:threonyl-tRNA synthetase
MTDAFVAVHKTKHLLSHVLVTAGARRWPTAMLGQSGETATGFYADFGLPGLPEEAELAELTDEMARVLLDFKIFREIRLSSEGAAKAFAAQRWKQHQAAVIAEQDPSVRCYELDGFVDICDCALKEPGELRAIHPEKFLLTQAHPVVWSHRAGDEFFIRITGEVFPLPPPCACCAP